MPRKKIPIKATDNLLVSMMNDMNGKLHHIHKDVEKNSKDIEKLKEEIAFGRGGVRVFVWAVGLATAILGYLNFK